MTERKDLTTKERKDLFLSAMALCLCNVSRACKVAQVNRQHIYTWMEQDQDFARAMVNMKESLIDYVEGKQLALIEALDGPQIRFFLQHQAKQRGYGQESTTRHEFPDGLPAGQQHLHIHLPKQPETLAEWETQVKELRRVRALPAPGETSGPGETAAPGETGETPINKSARARDITPINKSAADQDALQDVQEGTNGDLDKAEVALETLSTDHDHEAQEV